MAAPTSWTASLVSAMSSVGCGVGFPATISCSPTFVAGMRRFWIRLLTDLAAVLLKEDVVKLKTVARDGSGYETALEKAPFAGRRP